MYAYVVEVDDSCAGASPAIICVLDNRCSNLLIMTETGLDLHK